MRDQDWFNTLAGIVIVVVFLGAAFALLVAPPGSTVPRPISTAPSIPTVYRNLTVAFNPSTGGFDYSTSQLVVPSHVKVVFTITNFDAALALLPQASDARVIGTYGDPSLVIGAGKTSSFTQLPTNDVSHTFSIANPYAHVNVPIPPAGFGSGAPARVTFSVVFGTPGTYVWGCIVLCHSTMGATETMYGSLIVS